MTRKIVKTILGSDMTDGQFRDLSLTEPDEALAEWDLTPVRIEAIKDTELAEVRIRFARPKPRSEGVRSNKRSHLT
jgi:hypothetical protein